MARNKVTSTFDQEMKNPAFRAAFEKESAALKVSEFIAKKMAEKEVSVRRLAALSGISATVIQGIKSGSRKNIEYNTLRPLVNALGCRIVFKEEVKSRRSKTLA
jgi:DNA-binding Xre family transcriptional regulator